ncbi:MAG: hypothetical protein K2Y56_09265 [Methylobacterium sp.]|uniref:hypothetical protein n=1 Tax=Methylobacterium sp. TaxID=409 RepID=UPI0025F4DA9B|nr:hypothetical protein [Methylobacterium sp.]MBX9931710.1 hypothetical protein [Methylobacterium sp.]
MIGDTDTQNSPLALCTLPDPLDGRRGSTANVTFLCRILLKPSARSVSVLVRARLFAGIGPLVMWFYRFFGRTLGC